MAWVTAVMTLMPSGSHALMTCMLIELTFLHLYPVTKLSALQKSCAKLRRNSKLKAEGSLFNLFFIASEVVGIEHYDVGTDINTA